MKTKRIFLSSIWVIFTIVIVACSKATPSQNMNTNATHTLTVTLTTQPAQTNTPTITLTHRPSQTPQPTHTPQPPVILEGLRRAYIQDGNLYLQDDGKETIQLTNSGKDDWPMFSDDGQLLIVHREGDLVVVPTDGSEEQNLALRSLLTTLGLGYDLSYGIGTAKFVPGTHKLLFHTADDLLMFDIDSNKVTSLFRLGSEVHYFLASPNGKMALAWVADELDAINLTGNPSPQRLNHYPPDGRTTGIDTNIYWADDASKISIVLTEDKNSDFSHPEPLVVYQYFLDGRKPVEIHLEPPPVNMQSNSYRISPDGNWIAYSYCNDFTQPHTPEPDGAYLGNLQTGTSQYIIDRGCPNAYYWNIDSKWFIIDDYLRNFLADINGQVNLLHDGTKNEIWADDPHYTGEISIEEFVQLMKLGAENLDPYDPAHHTLIVVQTNTTPTPTATP